MTRTRCLIENEKKNQRNFFFSLKTRLRNLGHFLSLRPPGTRAPSVPTSELPTCASGQPVTYSLSPPYPLSLNFIFVYAWPLS